MSTYPTNKQLDAIKKWDPLDSHGLLEYVRELWAYPDYVKVKGKKYTFATGGWSGNEDIIAALEKNLVFHAICWYASYRGGKHIYMTPLIKRKKV